MSEAKGMASGRLSAATTPHSTDEPAAAPASIHPNLGFGELARALRALRIEAPESVCAAIEEIAERALAAAREEGRREGGRLRGELDAAEKHVAILQEQRASIEAAHAAQLVALREAQRAWDMAYVRRHPHYHFPDGPEALATHIEAQPLAPLPDAEAALARVREGAVREADTEDTPGPCTVRKIDEDDWELWCENPGTNEQPNGRRQLASFGTYAECRAVCNALNRVVTSFLNALGGGA